MFLSTGQSVDIFGYSSKKSSKKYKELKYFQKTVSKNYQSKAFNLNL